MPQLSFIIHSCEFTFAHQFINQSISNQFFQLMRKVFALIAMMLCFFGVSKGNAPPGQDLTRHELTVVVTADVQQAFVADVAINVQCYALDAPFVLNLSPPVTSDVLEETVAIVQVRNQAFDVTQFINIPTPAARDVVLNGIDELQIFSCNIHRSTLKSKLIRSLEPFSGHWQHYY